MKRKRRFAALLAAVFVALTCTGCAASGADQLYALPQLTDEYVQLEGLIAQRVSAGGEYAAPTAGSNRQTVQLHDLDGDGTAEAIAFLADRSHTPNICVYQQDGEGNYYLYTYIEGAGSAVSSVEYADLTGDGASELIVTWQISGDIRLLTVYALGGSEPQQLLSAACSGFLVCDLDGDGLSELMDLTEDYYGQTVTRYAYRDGGFAQTDARLTDGANDVLRMRAGLLSDGVQALFLESRLGENQLVTDVFTVSEDRLRNITADSAGRSDTLRTGDAFAADINGDRAMEIPESSGNMLNWYGIDSEGRKELVVTTFHDYEEGWYLELTDELTGASVDKREIVPGETAVTFTGEDGSLLLTIYTFTGENRLDWAEEEGRVILASDSVTVYAASCQDGSGLDQKEITDRFHLIYQEWQTGAL